MGRSPCCDEVNLTKGAWMPEEDKKLKDYIQDHGPGNWKILPKKAGLNRCGKSCRLRWTNYLRPDIKRGRFSEAEERLIIELHSILGNKWSAIAGRVPGRTDNEIKNYWNTHLRKKLLRMGIDPITHKPRIDLDLLTSFSKILGATTNLNSLVFPLDSDALRLQILQNLVQVITFNPAPKMVDSVSNTLYSNALQNYHDVEGFMGLPDLGFSGLNNYAYPESKNPHEQEMVPQIDNSWSISEFMMDSNGGSPASYGILSAQSSPSLISASSEDFTNMVPVQESTNLSTITSLGDSDYDLGWKEILDQISIASESS